jgi:hypothetical protein
MFNENPQLSNKDYMQNKDGVIYLLNPMKKI